MWFFIFIIAVAIISVGIIINQTNHRVGDEWTGVIEDRKYQTYYHKGKKEQYLLYVCKDSGKKVTLDVSAVSYNSLNTGDRIQKLKGNPDPVRIL